MAPCLFNKKFFSVDNELSYYWAGFLAADGCIHKNRLQLAVGRGDAHHLLRFKEDIESKHKITITQHLARIGIRSLELCSELGRRFNIFPNKSGYYEPPSLLDENLSRHFWRGLFDGDGWISVNSGKYPVIGLSGSFETIVEFSTYIRKWLAVRPHTPSKHSQSDKCFTTTYTGEPAFAVHDFLYSNCSRRLERKSTYGALQFS